MAGVHGGLARTERPQGWAEGHQVPLGRVRKCPSWEEPPERTRGLAGPPMTLESLASTP